MGLCQAHISPQNQELAGREERGEVRPAGREGEESLASAPERTCCLSVSHKGNPSQGILTRCSRITNCSLPLRDGERRRRRWGGEEKNQHVQTYKIGSCM